MNATTDSDRNVLGTKRGRDDLGPLLCSTVVRKSHTKINNTLKALDLVLTTMMTPDSGRYINILEFSLPKIQDKLIEHHRTNGKILSDLETSSLLSTWKHRVTTEIGYWDASCKINLTEKLENSTLEGIFPLPLSTYEVNINFYCGARKL